MKTFRVICITKHALFERIESIRVIDTTNSVEQRISEDEAIRLINDHEARFIVRDEQGHEAAVEVEQREGRRFLITVADGIRSDNLLALPRCEEKKVAVPPFRSVTPARSHGVHCSCGGADGF